MEMPEQVIRATLRVIQEGGVKDVTVRKVAEQLGRSTTVITHYFSTRDELLDAALTATLAQSREEAVAVMQSSEDPLWAFLNWSVSGQHHAVWLELVAAYAANLDPQVTKQVDEFLAWWDGQVEKLLEGRVVAGLTSKELCDIIGVVVEGILLSSNREFASGLQPEELLKITITPLLKK